MATPWHLNSKQTNRSCDDNHESWRTLHEKLSLDVIIRCDLSIRSFAHNSITLLGKFHKQSLQTRLHKTTATTYAKCQAR